MHALSHTAIAVKSSIEDIDELVLSRGFAPRTSAFAERRAELITL